MIRSHALEFNWRGHPAKLYLMRNDGYAWGRIIDVLGAEFDVNPPNGDVYDWDDTTALEFLAEYAIEQPNAVEDAEGWLQS